MFWVISKPLPLYHNVKKKIYAFSKQVETVLTFFFSSFLFPTKTDKNSSNGFYLLCLQGRLLKRFQSGFNLLHPVADYSIVDFAVGILHSALPCYPVGRQKRAENWALKQFMGGARFFSPFFLPCFFFKKKLELFLECQNLNAKNHFYPATWAIGFWNGVDHKTEILARAGSQRGNIQRRNPIYYHIVYFGEKADICQAAVEVLHHAIKSARFITPTHIPKMYSRNHVSWNIPNI